MAIALPERLARHHLYIMIDLGYPHMQMFLYSGDVDPSEFARHVSAIAAGAMSCLPGATGLCYTWCGFDSILEGTVGAIGYSCDGCGVRAQRMRQCDNCRFARYCSHRCQRRCWREHKASCPNICAAYDRVHRRSRGRINYYGSISAYEFHQWHHVLNNWTPF